jgi:SAM-dependent methyltransferase
LPRYKAPAIFNEQATAYDRWFVDSPVYATELDAVRSLRSPLPGPKLEVGVGTGRFAAELGVAFGIDPAGGMLRFARGRGIACCCGIGEELPIKDKTIGTVYLLFTLCFGAAPRKIIVECNRILKNNGYLVIGMIPALGTWGRHLSAKGRAGHSFYRHASFCTAAEICSWLTGGDMRIVETRSTLYRSPDDTRQNKEEIKNILDEQAGFVVIAARKGHV